MKWKVSQIVLGYAIDHLMPLANRMSYLVLYRGPINMLIMISLSRLLLDISNTQLVPRFHYKGAITIAD